MSENNCLQTLYSLLTFGVSLDANAPSPIDPPEHLFRIRLACVLLDTCGEYFNTGSSKKKLDCYLTYLQRYVWFKRSLPCWTPDHPFPLEAINLLDETLEKLRPKLKQFKNLEAAEAGVKQLEDEYREKVQSFSLVLLQVSYTLTIVSSLSLSLSRLFLSGRRGAEVRIDRRYFGSRRGRIRR